MNIALKELAVALQMPPETIERWIRQGRIPVRKKKAGCIFNPLTLNNWAKANNLTFDPKGAKPELEEADASDTLLETMERGGVFYDIKGEAVVDVIQAGVDRITCFGNEGYRNALFESLMAREELMSTGIGKGVAIPHPRTPLDYGDIPAFITACFLEKPMDYKAVDHQPVFILFFLICPSSKRHLHLLARLSFCLRDEKFIRFLADKPDQASFFTKIAELDRRFDSP